MQLIFKTIDEIKEFVPANNSNSIKTLKPAIKRATVKFIIPFIGEELYSALETAYAALPGTPMESTLAALLPYVQLPLAHLAYYNGLATLAVSLTDAGIQITEGSDFKAANPHQVDDLRRNFCENGFEGLDELLTFIEKQNTANGHYPEWKTSDAYTLSRDNFINTTRDFNKQVQINNSRFTFLALRPIISRIEETKLRPVLDVFYDQIKARIRGGLYSAGDLEVIARVQPAIAYLAAADALTELSVEITAGGFIVNHFKPLIQPKVTEAELKLLAARRDKFQELGNSFLKDLADFMNKTASAEVYPSYFNSTTYQAPDTADKGVYQPGAGGVVASF